MNKKLINITSDFDIKKYFVKLSVYNTYEIGNSGFNNEIKAHEILDPIGITPLLRNKRLLSHIDERTDEFNDAEEYHWDIFI